MFDSQTTGTAAELQLSAVQTGVSVAVRIELATIGGSATGAASTSGGMRPQIASRAADFLIQWGLVGRSGLRYDSVNNSLARYGWRDRPGKKLP